MIAGSAIRLGPRTLGEIRAVLGHTPPRAHPLVDLIGRELHAPAEVVHAAIARDVLADLVALNLLRPLADGYVARARLDRVGELLIASDLRQHRRSSDFVLGPGPSSFLLARHVRPHRTGRVLDLGCGSGIQSLLLGDRRTEVVGVDINPRAVQYANFNASLNGRPGMHAVVGNFLGAEPDRQLDGRFDTVVSNPPFVLAPRHELTYRDRPLAGDAVGARTVERVGRALSPGGRGYVFCNWIGREAIAGGAPDAWLEPVRGWLAGLGLDAVIVRIADLEPAAYAAVWNRDLLAVDRPGAIATWTEALELEKIRRVHLGVIALGRPRQRASAALRFTTLDGRRERVPWEAVEELLNHQPGGPHPMARAALGRPINA